MLCLSEETEKTDVKVFGVSPLAFYLSVLDPCVIYIYIYLQEYLHCLGHHQSRAKTLNTTVWPTSNGI